MNEDIIRQIARQEATKLFESNYAGGTVAPHLHNGADNLKLSQANLAEFLTLPSGLVNNTVVVKANVAKDVIVGSGNIKPTIIYGTSTSNTFQGGTAQEGTIIIFKSIESPTTISLTGATTKGDTTGTLTANWARTPAAPAVPTTYGLTGSYKAFFQGTPNQEITIKLTNASLSASWNPAAAGGYTNIVVVPTVQLWVYLGGYWYGQYLDYYST